MQLRRRPGLTFSTRGWSIQSGRVVNGFGSIFLHNLSYGTRMMKYLPENTFREWKRVTDPDEETHEPGQAWTIRDWQHQGYQRILSRYESFSTHHAPDQLLDGLHNPDISIQVEEMFTYAPPMSDVAHPSSLHLPPVFYGGTLPAQLGDPPSPSSERHRTERAISRSPRRCGYFGRR